MHASIAIGTEFISDGNRWRCTDKGTRTIVAIKLDQDDPSWYNGPPYSVAEAVFDEHDLEAVALSMEEWLEMYGEG
ncbi:MAG: hypothetical protein HQL95_04860 [Magnetococcales bacterium]|nr:hypothetical protein [Magnetococcales bacterium]